MIGEMSAESEEEADADIMWGYSGSDVNIVEQW